MGMYTKLDCDLVLQGLGKEDLELFVWLENPYKEDEKFPYKDFPQKYKDSTFFSKGRKSWFTDLKLERCEVGYTLKGSAELKNYESQIENLYLMIEPLVLSGTYKSLYEDCMDWYDHILGEYHEKEEDSEYVGW